MKFRYLFIILILIIPIIIITGIYLNSKKLKNENLRFIIPIVDNRTNYDSIILSMELKIPKYYTLKQYIRNESDCITCGEQSYIFYHNPTQETINENDTLIFGFIRPFEKARNIDSTLLSITTYRNVFSEEVLTLNSIDNLLSNLINRLKSDNPEITLIKKDTIIDGNNLNYIEYDYKEYKYYKNIGINYVSFFSKKNIFIQIKLQDLTFNKQLQQDFYKILQSVKIKVEYKGKNEELTKHFQKH